MKYPDENPTDRNPKHDEIVEDRELKHLLGEWGPPEVTSSLDQHILTSYRGQFRRPWRRWLTGSISLPAPVAMTVALLLVATSYLAIRNSASEAYAIPPSAPEVKFIVAPYPLIQEKIVTRSVYKTAAPQKIKKNPATISIPPRSELANFRPVSEIKPIVIQGGNDEK